MKRERIAALLAAGVMWGLAAGSCERHAGPLGEVEAEPAGEDPGRWIDCVPGGEAGWEVVAGDGSQWDAGADLLRIPASNGLCGVRWTGAVPEPPFEVELEARRTDGMDFFCGLTVPTRSVDECVTLVVGGWGGNLVGISSIDDLDASMNECALSMNFADGEWYRIRMRVAAEELTVWIDGEEKIRVETRDRRLGLRPGPIELCAPFGLATWETAGELRSIRWRRLVEGS